MAKYTSGNAEIHIDQDLGFLSKFISTVLPSASKIMEEESERIEKEAQREWPKRKPIVRTDANGKIVFFKETSKESWRLFKRGITVDANGNLVVYMKNTAPYSYVIRFGEDSKNAQGKEIIQPSGKNVSQELLIKPHRKSANKVVKALANDLAKRL